MISFALDDEQRLVQETVRKFAVEVVRPAMRAWEQAREVPLSARRAFHELSLGLLDVPEAMGGAGQPLLTACLAHEELAAGDPAAAIALWAPHLAAAAVCELAGDEQGSRLLAPLAATDGAERLGALAWSEPPGAPVEGFATRAERDAAGGGWRLTGEKLFVVNGGRAALTVVFAQVEPGRGWDGIGAFVVEGQAVPGLSAGERVQLLGLDAVHVAPLRLDGVLVPEAARLDGRGDFARGLDRLWCRAILVGAARQVGLARAAYEFALGYTQDRQAFGKAVAHFQAIAFTLAEMHMDVESARWLVWRAAAELDGGRDAALAARLAAEAVTHANEVSFRVANDGVQLLGGAGFIRDFPSEKWMREARALAMCAPTDQLAQLAAASLLVGESAAHALCPPAAIQPVVT